MPIKIVVVLFVAMALTGCSMTTYKGGVCFGDSCPMEQTGTQVPVAMTQVPAVTQVPAATLVPTATQSVDAPKVPAPVTSCSGEVPGNLAQVELLVVKAGSCQTFYTGPQPRAVTVLLGEGEFAHAWHAGTIFVMKGKGTYLVPLSDAVRIFSMVDLNGLPYNPEFELERLKGVFPSYTVMILIPKT